MHAEPSRAVARAVTWGDLALDIPEDFTDESIILLRGPSPRSLVARRLTAEPPPGPSYVCKRTLLGPAPPPLETLADAELRSLQSVVAGLTLHSRAVEDVGGRPTVILEASFDSPGGRLRNVQATTVLGAFACSFVATAFDDLNFASVRQQLHALLASARLMTP
jgi:hypothetical protein